MIPTVPHLLTAAARGGLVACLILIGSVAAGASDAAELTAILIEEGSVAESQVVALGRNVKVGRQGHCRSDGSRRVDRGSLASPRGTLS